MFFHLLHLNHKVADFVRHSLKNFSSCVRLEELLMIAKFVSFHSQICLDILVPFHILSPDLLTSGRFPV